MTTTIAVPESSTQFNTLSGPLDDHLQPPADQHVCSRNINSGDLRSALRQCNCGRAANASGCHRYHGNLSIEKLVPA